MIVLKLGGSLLTLPDLASRIERVTAQRPGASIAMVIGGGAAADLVRDWDRVHRLGDETSHHLALQAMQLNAGLVARLLPASRIVTSRPEVAAAWSDGAWPLLDAGAWLSAAEAAGRTTVPHTWRATSDSIAGWLVEEFQAGELVLLKSVTRPVGGVRQAAAEGVVDECFPDAVARLPRISWVNFRTEECRIENWILKGDRDTSDGEHRS